MPASLNTLREASSNPPDAAHRPSLATPPPSFRLSVGRAEKTLARAAVAPQVRAARGTRGRVVDDAHIDAVDMSIKTEHPIRPSRRAFE